MSDVMLFGVLRMPMEMAMADDLSRMQFYQRAQQAADRIEELERQLAERDAQQERQIGREPTDAMQAAGTQAIRFDTTLLNKMWTANAVFRAMWDAADPSAPSVSADAGWISVNDRLPAENEDVFATGPKYNDAFYERGRYYAAALFVKGEFLDEETGDDMHPPSHWMPRVAVPGDQSKGSSND